MPNTKDATFEKFEAKILQYAISGFGKTLAFAGLPGPRYMLNFDRENRLTLEINHVDVEYDDIDCRPGIEGYESVLKKVLEMKERFKQGKGPKSICIDTGKDLFKVCMYYVLKVQGKEMPTQPDWGLAQERCMQRLNDFLDLPCNLLVNFHEQIEKDDVKGGLFGTINVPGKDFPNEILKKFNIKLHGVTEAGAKPGEFKRLWHTKNTPLFTADDKTGALDFAEPFDSASDMTRIFNKIKDKFEKERPKS